MFVREEKMTSDMASHIRFHTASLQGVWSAGSSAI